MHLVGLFIQLITMRGQYNIKFNVLLMFLEIVLFDDCGYCSFLSRLPYHYVQIILTLFNIQ